MSFDIFGLHPVEAADSCYLIEVKLSDPIPFDWGSVTQEIEGEPQSNWQAVWDEQPIGENRWVFFFHHLDLERPLITSLGRIQLPKPTPLPARLSEIRYEPPC